ncbi:CHAT domain-containing protein [Pseudonocardia abyssalis]|uniref:CHAT domain-containing protein n=1 Tax=Pseudonocardia abyssalis TaxID=2792008 RepID=A0ABS6UYK4_9PSEU|nr:CHAT domain-containing protein [Pseudonocardia abyssalis]MBW0113938.1 CHAT domain-containing protein [Pseudonocardia abyssalis]MBW0136978.1 CHAT domain-containing protein [Pseudonocardia abyssalis]
MTGAVEQSPTGGLLIRAIAAHDGTVGDPAAFSGVARQVLAEARRAGEVESQVVALRAVAWAERAQQENVRALRLLQEAARLARRARLPHRLGEVLTTRAAVHLELGRTDAARRDLARAASLVSAAAAPDLSLKQAVLLCNVGRIDEGARILRAVVNAPDAPVDVRMRAATNLSLAESLLGHAPEAMRHGDLAVELAPRVGPALLAFAVLNRGIVLAQSGRVAEALDQFERAETLMVAAGLPVGEVLVEHAETLAALRVPAEAADLCRRAAEELERHHVPLMAAEARLRLAEIALLSGDVGAASVAAERAIEQFRRQRRVGWTALATVVAVEAARQAGGAGPADLRRVRRAADVLGRLRMVGAAVEADLVVGRMAAAGGNVGLARSRWAAAHERSRGGAVLVRLRGRLAGALAASAARHDASVLAHCRAGLADLAAHRAALASMELRAMASGHGVELGALGLDVLLRAGRPGRVFDWTERTRAAALLAVAPPVPEAVGAELAALAALRTEITEARRDTGREPAELLDRQTAGEARIRRATWRRSVPDVAPGSARSAREVRDLLDDRTLVSYVRHGSELVAVLLDRTRTRTVPLGPLAPLRFEADALQFALRRLTRPGSPAALGSARASAEHALDRLRELAVAALGLDPDVPLVVVPTGDTHRVSWSALHRGPVEVASSASLWAATRTRARTGGPVVVVAGPDLPGATAEAVAVAARHPGARVLTPDLATTDAVVAAMSGAGLVHLACHGVLRADNPIFSALTMADGPLTVHEMDLRGVAPDRIVLASCDSAADTAYAGDEVLGFVGALLARGTAGVVASVVAVGDAESVTLMEPLHAELAVGATTARALHRARAGLDTAEHRHFVNWCGFTAYGAG